MPRPRLNAPARVYFDEAIDAEVLAILEQVGDLSSLSDFATEMGLSFPKLSGLYRSRRGKLARSKATPQSKREYKSHLVDSCRTSEHPSVLEADLTKHGFIISDRPDIRLSEVGSIPIPPLTSFQEELIIQVLELLGDNSSVSGLAKYASTSEALVRLFLLKDRAILAISKATPETKKAYSGLLGESQTMTKNLYPEDRK